MAVSKIRKNCEGCKKGSGYQRDHNHFIIDSIEYETAKLIMVIFVIVLAIVLFIYFWLKT